MSYSTTSYGHRPLYGATSPSTDSPDSPFNTMAQPRYGAPDVAYPSQPSSRVSHGETPRIPITRTNTNAIDTKAETQADTWMDYCKHARTEDEEITRKWNSDLDSLLTFAALFSAVLATFVVESYKTLLPDSGNSSAALLREILSSQLPPERRLITSAMVMQHDTLFTPPRSAVRVNGLWFASLLTSLSTAFLTILAKQWVLNLRDNLSPSPKVQARQRQFRYDNAKRWRLHAWLASLPVFLHIALLLFFAGMAEFTKGLNQTVYVISISIVAVTGTIYVITHILTLCFSSCPYKTSLAVVLLSSFDSTAKEIYADILTAISMTPNVILALLQPWKKKRDAHGNETFYMHTVASESSRLRSFFRRLWQDKTLSWSSWSLREHKIVSQVKDTLDLRALAWMIGQWLWKSNDYQLWQGVCNISDLLHYRRLFIDAGAVALLADEIMTRWQRGTPSNVQSTDAKVVLRCSTTLVSLLTESQEDDHVAAPLVRNGIARYIETSQTGRTHLLYSGLVKILQPDTIRSRHNLVLSAVLLRLHVFALPDVAIESDDLEKRDRVAGPVISFLQDAVNIPLVQGLKSEGLIAVVNTAIYVGLRKVLIYKDSGPDDGVYGTGLLRCQRASWDVLMMMINAPQIPIKLKLWSQLCWGIWALSTSDLSAGLGYFGHSETLVPIFSGSDTKNLHGPLTEILTQRWSQLPILHASLLLLNRATMFDSTHSERVQLFRTFADALSEMSRALCSDRTELDVHHNSFKPAFELILELWPQALQYLANQQTRMYEQNADASSQAQHALRVDVTPFSNIIKFACTRLTAEYIWERASHIVIAYRAVCCVTILHLSASAFGPISFQQSTPSDAARDIVQTLHLLNSRAIQRERLPPEPVSRGFMYILTHALTEDPLDVKDSCRSSVRQILKESSHDLDTLLSNLAHAGIPGAPEARGALQYPTGFQRQTTFQNIVNRSRRVFFTL